MAKKEIKKFLKDNFLIILGLFLLSSFVVWRYHQARILSFSSKITPAEIGESTIGFVPSHIKAYPVGVDVDITRATIVNGVWPVFPTTAGYVLNGKNLIIYGHNKDEIMGPIRWIKEDAEITLIDLNGEEHKFKVVKTDEVDPNNLSYIEKTNEETLTVYTCTGFLDSKRFIVVAKRIN